MKQYIWKLAKWLHHFDFAHALPFMARLPVSLGYTLARWRGALNGATGRDWRSMGLGFRHIHRQSRLAYAQLHPQASEAQLDAWRRQRFMAEAMDEFEARWLAAGRVPELTCEFDPPNALDLLRQREKGLLLLTPHFESFFLGVCFLGRSQETINIMTSAVTHDPRVDSAVKKHFEAKYRGLEQYLNGGKAVDMEEGIRPFYEMLQRQEILVLLGDAPVLPNGASMKVNFLEGQRTIAGGGPRIAQRTHSDIGGFVCIPLRKGHYKLILTPTAPASSPEAIQHIYDFFTRHMMQNPGGWWASDLLPAMPVENESRPEK